MQTYANVDDYIEKQPQEHQTVLRAIRQTIQKAAPEAVESISYGMPAYKYCGLPLVYFACGKHHFGFYPTPSGVEAFRGELHDYSTSKGAIQFPHDQPIPFDLVTEITTFKVSENRSIHGKSIDRNF